MNIEWQADTTGPRIETGTIDGEPVARILKAPQHPGLLRVAVQDANGALSVAESLHGTPHFETIERARQGAELLYENRHRSIEEQSRLLEGMEGQD